MRSTLALTATVLALAWAAPASAQMCGGSPSTTGASATTAGGGMMCGMGQRAATDPMAEPSTPSQGQRAAGGCPCCRNMAMMQGGMGGMMGGGQRPAQPSTPTPSTPTQPSMPDMPGMTPRQ